MFGKVKLVINKGRLLCIVPEEEAKCIITEQLLITQFFLYFNNKFTKNTKIKNIDYVQQNKYNTLTEYVLCETMIIHPSPLQ